MNPNTNEQHRPTGKKPNKITNKNWDFADETHTILYIENNSNIHSISVTCCCCRHGNVRNDGENGVH
jgi:hypothetical protein